MSDFTSSSQHDVDEKDDGDYHDLDLLLSIEDNNSRSKGEVVGQSSEVGNFIVERHDTPYVGLQFESEPAAYAFYNQYAASRGFGIRRNRNRKNRTGIVFQKNFCCYKEGMKRKKNTEKEPRYIRRERRTNCKASMDVELKEGGMWVVIRFNDKHNHELLNANQTFTLRSHRGVKGCWKSIINLAEAAGIQPHQTYDFMVEQSGGFEKMGFLRGDHYNHISTQRRSEAQKGDAIVLKEYLRRRKALDKSFSYEIQVDSDLVVTNFFWTDGRSILDYNYFGDVVCFDTTYKTNRYGRPMGVFVGINHHRHTCVFGATMLYDETIESFVWLFSTFLKTMSCKAPITIMTDQDPGMAAAIEIVLPSTHHRICIWHICQNAPCRLGGIFNMVVNGTKVFPQVFKRCIFEDNDEDDFIMLWNNMLEDFNLKENEWLKRLFDIKEKWALVYGRQAFGGGMRTTQCSESFNRDLKSHLHSRKDLSRFFQSYDRLLKKQRAKEFEADCNDVSSNVKLAFSSSLILKQLNSLYTAKSYKYQEEEYELICDTRILQMHETISMREFVVGSLKSSKICTVSYNIMENEATCSCQTFEFKGILCRHIFQVFQQQGVTQIPKKYILKRWMKVAKDKIRLNLSDTIVDLGEDAIRAQRMAHMHSLFLRIADESVEDEEIYKSGVALMEAIVSDVGAMKRRRKSIQEGNSIVSKSVTMSTYKDSPIGDIDDTATSPQINGFKKKEREKGRHRIKSCLERGKKKAHIDMANMKAKRKLDPLVVSKLPLEEEPIIEQTLPTLFHKTVDIISPDVGTTTSLSTFPSTSHVGTSHLSFMGLLHAYGIVDQIQSSGTQNPKK